MFPSISDLINYIFGTDIHIPVQTYGFFLAVAILVAVYVLKIELKRMEKMGYLQPQKKKIIKGLPASKWELLSTAVVSFLVGYKFVGIFVDYSEFSNNTQEYILSSKGSIIGGLVLSAIFVAYTFWKKHKAKLDTPVEEEIDVFPHQLTGTILILTAVSGVLGAKIFHNLENFSELIANPVDSLTSFMGLTFYGGLILGSATLLYYAHRNKINLRYFLDANAPALITGYGLGRVACMMSGDGCWGIVNTAPKPSWLSFLPDWMWSFKFPHNVINDGVIMDNCTGKFCTVLPEGVFPTSFYDTVLCLLIFIILWSIRKRIKIPGVLFSITIVMIGIQRFFMEKIRVNNKLDIFGFKITQAEIISVILILLGALGIYYFIKYYRKQQNKNADTQV
jgi:prolipoprotein diacylglyceryltransferase